MQSQYIALVGNTPKIVGLNTNSENFQVLVRCSSGVTLEGTVDNPSDSSALDGNPATNPNAAVWTAITLSASGYANLSAGAGGVPGTGFAPGPWQALRFTPTAGGAATILQNGIK